MMRFFKILLVLFTLLFLGCGISLGYLYQKGFFADPQVALRELEKQGIPATPASVFQAATSGNLAKLSVLARAGVDFSIPDELGRTPLHLALENDHLQSIGFLRQQGYDLDARDQAGNTPLSLTLDRDLHKLAAQFIEEGASPNFTLPSGELALPGYHQAERHQDVAFLLQHEANPNSPALNGQSTLALSLQDGQGGLACKLLEKGADPKSLVFGEPALIAVLKEHKNWKLEPTNTTRVLGTLLVSGADPELAGSDGQRPIQIALANDFRPALELLLPRIQNVDGCLWLAIKHNNVAAIENLLAKGTPVEEVGPDGDTPLIHAIRHDKTDLLASLLSADADPNQFSKEGQRALFFALACQNEAATLTLLNHQNGPDLSVIMEDPVSEEFRDLFSRKGLFDWYCRNETGLTPLMAAVMLRNLPVTERLLELGMNKFQGTAKPGVVFPIQMAAKNGDIKMQQLLLGVPYGDDEQARHFVIDLSSQKVTYYEHGEVKKTSRISSGKSGYRTPTGKFVITDKSRHHKSNLYGGAAMNYFQRFSCRAEGFHEGYTGSRFASHGCVRLSRSTAQYFWSKTKIGDRVTIQP